MKKNLTNKTKNNQLTEAEVWRCERKYLLRNHIYIGRGFNNDSLCSCGGRFTKHILFSKKS